MKIICMIILMLAALSPNPDIRYDNAVVTESYYDYGDNANIVYLETTDGNEWAIYNTIMPEGTECILKFSTKGNENIYDDEIINVIWLQEM